MKRLLIIITIKLFSIPIFAQKDSIRGNKYELTGAIINEVSLTPHCGNIAWGTVVEFKIIKFNDSKYKEDTIAVIFTCPEFYKEGFFKVGNKYQLSVANQNQADFVWTIPNESILKKYEMGKRLYVISAEILK